MEALSIRLDGMETLAASSKGSLGLRNSMQGESNFSLVLNNAIKATDGVQKPVEFTKPQEKQPEKVAERTENVNADDSKLKQIVSESDKSETKETSDNVSKTENAADEKAAVAEETEVKEESAVLAAEDSEAVEAEEVLALAENLQTEADETKIVAKDSEDSKNSLMENVMESVLLHDESAEEVADSLDESSEIEGLSKKTAKKSDKTKENASLFANVLSEKTNDPAKIEENLSEDILVQSAGAKKQEAPLIEVIDERTFAANDSEESSGLVSNVTFDDGGTAEMTLNLADTQAQNVAQIKDGVPLQEGSKSAFASMLSTEIKNNAGEFVKTGLITLRDNKSGTINLVLHPEELGNVKIKLELSDKLITGKIIVSSEEAYGAFKNNIENLRQAFLNSGFETAGFELAWSGSGEGNGHKGAEQGKNPHGIDYADSMPLAAGAEDMGDEYFGLTSVNVIV